MIANPEIFLRLGSVVTCTEGQDWVFVGYGVTTVSHNLRFFCVRTEVVYRATHRDTLVKKFPKILDHEVSTRQE
jgi:hypothetical protein